jgi:hypothetical protein
MLRCLFSFVWIASALVDSSAIAGGGERCTEIGCGWTGLIIEAPQGYDWRPGKYHFQLSIDGKAVQCEARLPLPACGIPAVQCNGRGVYVEESGCALPPESHGFGKIMVQSYPSQVQIQISHNGLVLGSSSLRPHYQESRPNGPRCEPVCRQASHVMELR